MDFNRISSMNANLRNSGTAQNPIPLMNITVNSNQSFGQNMPPQQQEIAPLSTQMIQGKVTQIFTSFGYINDNIIFSKSNVVGPKVHMGDSVAVETSFHPQSNLMFRAEKVWLVQSSMPLLTNQQQEQQQFVPQPMTPTTTMSMEPRESSVLAPACISMGLKKKRQKRGGARKKRTAVALAELENRNAIKAISVVKPLKTTKKAMQPEKSPATAAVAVGPPPRPGLPIVTTATGLPLAAALARVPTAQIFQSPLNEDDLGQREMESRHLRTRYRELTVPRQFCHLSLAYQTSLPLHRPLRLGSRCQFQIMDPSVVCPDNDTAQLLAAPTDPPDADSLFLVRVCLLNCPDVCELLNQTLRYSEDASAKKPVRLGSILRLLVASAGTHNHIAIGGPWSPSLDGDNPGTDPATLVKTAIRTVRAVTGIDLSGCNLWHRFLEFRYHRPGVGGAFKGDCDSKYSRSSTGGRLETVVYLLPDVWSLMPTAPAWNEIKLQYQAQLTKIVAPWRPPNPGHTKLEQRNENEDELGPISSVPSKSPDNMSTLELRQQLQDRNINHRGLSIQLKTRLKKAIADEDDRRQEKQKDSLGLQAAEMSSAMTGAQKLAVRIAYRLPDSPQILTLPNANLTLSGMTLRNVDLETLTKYDEKLYGESNFELVIVVEHLQQMLRRDAVWRLLASVWSRPVVSETEWQQQLQQRKPPVLAVTGSGAVVTASAAATTTRITYDRHLLFCCSLLDPDGSGGIHVQTLTKAVDSLGLGLSISQINRLLGQLSDMETLWYRSLTDMFVVDRDKAGCVVAGDKKGAGGGSEEEQEMELLTQLLKDNLASMERASVAESCSSNDQQQINGDRNDKRELENVREALARVERREIANRIGTAVSEEKSRMWYQRSAKLNVEVARSRSGWRRWRRRALVAKQQLSAMRGLAAELARAVAGEGEDTGVTLDLTQDDSDNAQTEDEGLWEPDDIEIGDESEEEDEAWMETEQDDQLEFKESRDENIGPVSVATLLDRLFQEADEVQQELLLESIQKIVKACVLTSAEADDVIDRIFLNEQDEDHRTKSVHKHRVNIMKLTRKFKSRRFGEPSTNERGEASSSNQMEETKSTSNERLEASSSNQMEETDSASNEKTEALSYNQMEVTEPGLEKEQSSANESASNENAGVMEIGLVKEQLSANESASNESAVVMETELEKEQSSANGSASNESAVAMETELEK